MAFPVTHHYKKRKGANLLVRVTPVSRVSEGRESVLLHKGKYTNLEGVPIPDEDVPQWAKDAFDKLKPERKLSLGFGVQEPEPEPAPSPSRSRGRRASVLESSDETED